MKIGKLNLFFAIWVVLAVMASPAPACTGITVKAQDGTVIHARTLEFAQDLQSQVLMIPRGYGLASSGPGGKPGLTWKSGYAVLGMDFLGRTVIADGMNEKGLAAGLFYLPGFAQYQKVTPADQDKCLAPWDLPMWVLTRFACDLKNLKLYFATYENLVPKMVDFKKLNMHGGQLLRIPITGGPFYEDVTEQAK